MTDLSKMSDADLLAALQATPDVGSMVTQEAQRQGVPPALALSVARTESGLNPDARSPKGAVGPMQLMPTTAADLGVDPHDTADNIRGGVAYLKQQLDRFGDPSLAVAAYNAGPRAVEHHGGIPPYAETQAYVQKVLGVANAGDQGADPIRSMSDADLLAALGIGPAKGAPKSAPGGQMAPPANPPPRQAALGPGGPPIGGGAPLPVQDAPNAPVRRGVDLAAEARMGFFAPINKLIADVQDSYAKSRKRAAAPAGSIGQGLAEGASDLGDTVRNIGDAAAVFGAPFQAVLRPIAAGMAQAPLPMYSSPKLAMQGGKLAVLPGRPITGEARVDETLNGLNTALSAIKPAAPGMALPKPMSLDELRAAKSAAYAKVDQSGFAFPQSDVQKLAQDVAAEVARKGGPSAAQLYPASKAMSERLTALANQPGGVPLSQLDELRSDIYGALVKPGDREAPLGVMMRGKIDDLINAANAPDIAKARDLNTRFMKMSAVTEKLDSAGLRSASTYSGGNYNNAVRQNLRPLVDPTSAEQIGNLTPEEDALLRKAVQGTPTQNATRYATKILTNKMVQAPVAVLTAGAGPAVMEAAGSVLNRVGQNQTQKAVQRVLDLISIGRQAQQAAPPIAPLVLAGRPAVPLLSGTGLVGGGVLASHVPQKRAAR